VVESVCELVNVDIGKLQSGPFVCEIGTSRPVFCYQCSRLLAKPIIPKSG